MAFSLFFISPFILHPSSFDSLPYMTSTTSSRSDLPLHENNSASSPSSFSLPLLGSVIALFVAARLWRLTTSCLWFDEIFGVHAARMKWMEMLKFVAADIIHPPLFYVLLKLWIALGGESLLWLRLLPVVLSTAALVPLILLSRELKLRANEINLAIALLAVSGYLIKYAQEVRMYSLLFFVTCLSLWFFVKYVNAKNNSIPWLATLTAVNILLVYSHYYGWFVVFIEAFTLLIWWRRKALGFLLSVALLIVSYLPWLYLINISREPGRGLAQNIGWVARPGVGDVAQFFSMLNTPFFFRQSSVSSFNDVWSICLSLILFGVPIAILIWQNIQTRTRDVENGRMIWGLLGFAVVPGAIALLLSWILPHSIWGTRHLIIAAVPYAILAALALYRLRPSWARIACLALLGCWVLLNGTVVLLKRPTNFIWCNWEPLAQQMMKLEENATREVQVYAYEDLVAYHLWFAADTARREGRLGNLKIHVAKGIPGLAEDPAYFLPRRFYDIETQDGAALKGDAIWIAFRDSAWHPDRPPLSLLPPQGYETGKVFELPAQGQKAFMVEVRRRGEQ